MWKKIIKEGNELSKKTGVDFKRYHSPELVEKIGNLIDFFGAIRDVLLLCYLVLLAIVIGLCVLFAWQGMHTVGVILFFIVGLAFIVTGGSAMAFMKLAEIAVNDTKGVLLLMLDFVADVKEDVATAIKNIPNAEIAGDDLFKGLSFLVFIPAVTQIVKDRLFFLLALPANYLIERAMYYFTHAVSPLVKTAIGKISSKEVKDLKKFTADMAEIKKKITPLAESVIRNVKIPGRVLLIVSLVICIPLLVVIYLVF